MSNHFCSVITVCVLACRRERVVNILKYIFYLSDREASFLVLVLSLLHLLQSPFFVIPSRRSISLTKESQRSRYDKILSGYELVPVLYIKFTLAICNLYDGPLREHRKGFHVKTMVNKFHRTNVADRNMVKEQLLVMFAFVHSGERGR